MENSIVQMFKAVKHEAQTTTAEDRLIEIIDQATKLISLAWSHLGARPMLNTNLRKIIEDVPQLRINAVVILLGQEPDEADLTCILEHCRNPHFAEKAARLLLEMEVDSDALDYIIDRDDVLSAQVVRRAKIRQKTMRR